MLHHHARTAAALLAVGSIAIVAGPATGKAAAPDPCNGVVQITDRAADSHHANTDIVRVWFHRADGGTVTANLEIATLGPAIDHTENDRIVWRLSFRDPSGGARYVQATAPRSGAPSFEFGTGGGTAATRQGETTGALYPGKRGVVSIVVPGALAPAGGVIGSPVAIAGEANALRTEWFERAPGGDDPTDASDTTTGSDWRVATCGTGSGAGGTGSGGSGTSGTGGPGTGAGDGSGDGTTVAGGTISGIGLSRASVRTRYGRTVLLRGAVAPATPGVVVEVLDTAGSVRTRLTTDAKGAFAFRVRVWRPGTMRVRAGGLTSGATTIAMRPRVTLERPRRTSSGLRLAGSVTPGGGSVVLEQRSGGSWIEVGTARVRGGSFSKHLRGVRRGQFRAVAADGTAPSTPRSIR